MKYLAFFSTILILSSCVSLRGTQNASFSSKEEAMILESDSNAPMRVFKINSYEDSILLRKSSQTIEPNLKDEVQQQFIDRLYATVTDSASLGVGIAAPQVGVLQRIIWVQRFDKENFPFEVYLNPVIKQYSELKQPCLEGCLSIPGRRDTTQDRAYAILLEYDQRDGTHVTEMIEDFTAVIFQHEIDHLNGILYLDHLEKEMKEAKAE